MSNYPQTTTDGYAPKLKRLQQLSKLLDNMITIPGTNVGIGLDPIIGLLPIGGDVLSFMFSFYIIIESAQMGVPKATLGKMIMNVIIDGLIGAFPMLGDLFDFAWKANNYNLQLLEESLKKSPANEKADKVFIILLIIGLVILSIILISIPIIIIRFLWQILSGS